MTPEKIEICLHCQHLKDEHDKNGECSHYLDEYGWKCSCNNTTQNYLCYVPEQKLLDKQKEYELLEIERLQNFEAIEKLEAELAKALKEIGNLKMERDMWKSVRCPTELHRQLQDACIRNLKLQEEKEFIAYEAFLLSEASTSQLYEIDLLREEKMQMWTDKDVEGMATRWGITNVPIDDIIQQFKQERKKA